MRESRLSQLVGDAVRGQKSLDDKKFRAEAKIVFDVNFFISIFYIISNPLLL